VQVSDRPTRYFAVAPTRVTGIVSVSPQPRRLPGAAERHGDIIQQILRD